MSDITITQQPQSPAPSQGPDVSPAAGSNGSGGNRKPPGDQFDLTRETMTEGRPNSKVSGMVPEARKELKPEPSMTDRLAASRGYDDPNRNISPDRTQDHGIRR